MNKLALGQIVVITNNIPFTPEYGKSIVFYINKDFPLSIFNNCIKKNFYLAREATVIEKDYCFWCYETLNKEGANLDGLSNYLEYKKINSL